MKQLSTTRAILTLTSAHNTIKQKTTSFMVIVLKSE